jgi:hypothetical protein
MAEFLRRHSQISLPRCAWKTAQMLRSLIVVEGELWVGNFGDGRINNYSPITRAFIETLMRADGTPLQSDGLWDLLPLGDGVYFAAGIADEEHGLFGLITEDEN